MGHLGRVVGVGLVGAGGGGAGDADGRDVDSVNVGVGGSDGGVAGGCFGEGQSDEGGVGAGGVLFGVERAVVASVVPPPLCPLGSPVSRWLSAAVVMVLVSQVFGLALTAQAGV